MRFAMGWILYGAPLAATVFAWVGLAALAHREQADYQDPSCFAGNSVGIVGLRRSGICGVREASFAPRDFRIRSSRSRTISLGHDSGLGHASIPTMVFFAGTSCVSIDVCPVLSSWHDSLKPRYFSC